MASSPITSCQIDWETKERMKDFIFLGSKITANGDCSHKTKRHLSLERKAMNGRDITLPTKVHMSNLSFPNSHHVCMGELDNKQS